MSEELLEQIEDVIGHLEGIEATLELVANVQEDSECGKVVILAAEILEGDMSTLRSICEAFR